MALVVLNTVTSTMDVAKKMLKLDQVSFIDSNRTEPGGIIAFEQTEGRGQRGRTWYSVPEESLCVTYFMPLTNEAFRETGKIAILAGTAVANALEGAFGSGNSREDSDMETGITDRPLSQFGLKWPNDLVMSGKKLGGILVEIVQNSCNEMIGLIGVGLNIGVQSFPSELAAVSTSLVIEGLGSKSPVLLADSIRESLDRSMAKQLMYGFSATIANWRQYDKTVGRRYRTETGDGMAIGVAVEVDADGALIILAENGSLLKVISASATSEM